MKKVLQFALILFFSSVTILTIAKNQVVRLVCEYNVNPIGIDIQKPRLSWQILSDEQNVMQSAYEIRVADTPANLKEPASYFGILVKLPAINR
jgi:alpha-L-rhamnosidase